MTTITAPAHHREVNGLGVAGLVLGIIAVLVCTVPLVGFVGLPLALIGLGLAIPGFLKANSGHAANFGTALAGLILSGIAFCAGTIWVLIWIAALANGTPEDAAAAAEANTQLTAEQTKAEATAKTAGLKSAIGSGHVVKLGAPVILEDMFGTSQASFTVDKFSPTAKANDGFSTPSAGNKYVAAHVIVRNVGGSKYTNISWIGAKVYTKKGQGYDMEPISSPSNGPALPSSIDLKPGGTVDGWMLFEVPAGDKLDSLAFDEAEWKL